LKILKWDKKVTESKIKDLLAKFKDHQDSNTKRFRDNEAIYKSEFYNEWNGTAFTSNRTLRTDSKKDQWSVTACMNHTFTFIRLLHSMLIQNEPIVTVSPANATAESKEAASGGDMVVRYSRRKYDVQAHVSSLVLNTLIYGIGNLRVDWNPLLGEIASVDEKGENVTMDGDADLRVVEPYNYLIISSSNEMKDIYGYVERIYMEKDEAQAVYPDFYEEFENSQDTVSYDVSSNKQKKEAGKVCIFEYLEKGRAFNANLGRRVVFLENGTILDQGDNPYDHKQIPCTFFTDIDVPDTLYPLSIIDMLRDPQKQVNDIMSRLLENVKLYSKIFLLVDRNAGLNEDAYTNDPTVPVEYNGVEGRPPSPMSPPSLPSFVFDAYSMLVDMMQHIAGIRDFSRGQMTKAVSGFTANLMIEADNKVHLQVHEKYKKSIKDIYGFILKMYQQYKTEEELITILNEDNDIETEAFKGANLNGGFDVEVDYGTTLPVDPASRRDLVREIATYAQQMGVPVDGNKVLDLMKLGDVIGSYDINKSAAKVQTREVKQMIDTHEYIKIDYDAQNHMGHYTNMQDYMNSGDYENLDDIQKQLLKDHSNKHMWAFTMQQQGLNEEEAMEQEAMIQAQKQGFPGGPGVPAPTPEPGIEATGAEQTNEAGLDEQMLQQLMGSVPTP
jgi:hypothetical protein